MCGQIEFEFFPKKNRKKNFPEKKIQLIDWHIKRKKFFGKKNLLTGNVIYERDTNSCNNISNRFQIKKI